MAMVPDMKTRSVMAAKQATSTKTETLRTKFQATSVVTGDGEVTTVRLEEIVNPDASGINENLAWTAGDPKAFIYLHVNKEVAPLFQAGGNYYLDITKAE